MQEKIILVIDDNDAIREFFEVFLTWRGHKVILAKDGREGIEIIAKEYNNLDLVITDREMPHMLGEEVVRIVKLHYPHLKVVFMTAQLDEAIASAAKAAGADLVIEKSADTPERIHKFLIGGGE